MTEQPKRKLNSGVVRKGPVKARQLQRELLKSDDKDWSRSDPWRVLRIQTEFVEGFEALEDLGPAVSLFGSARTKPDDPLFQVGYDIGRALAERGVAVITGAGPGTMQAANKGADDNGGVSVGLGIELPFEDTMNPSVNLGIMFRYFFARKVMFLKYAQGFIVMPGGYGTFDELFETLTLIQTGTVEDFPLVLFGTDYWQGLLSWIEDTMLRRGFISPGDLDYMTLTDDVDEAVEAACARITRGA